MRVPRKRRCLRCGEDKVPGAFASNSSRGKPLVSLCKLCVSEASKYSIRMNRMLPKYEALVAAWPVVKLLSEQAWLQRKLEAVERELRKAG